MNYKITVETQNVAPEPMTMTFDGVSFRIPGTLATFYKWFEFLGMKEEFLTEARPYWWKYYQNALRIKQAEEDRKREAHDSYVANLNAKKNAERKQRRIEMKNSVLSPENAVSLKMS